MSDRAQLEDNTTYMQDFKTLTTDEHQIIAEAMEIIQEAIAIPCTACQYCVEYFPMTIPIPQYFFMYNKKKQTKELPYYVCTL